LNWNQVGAHTSAGAVEVPAEVPAEEVKA